MDFSHLYSPSLFLTFSLSLFRFSLFPFHFSLFLSLKVLKRTAFLQEEATGTTGPLGLRELEDRALQVLIGLGVVVAADAHVTRPVKGLGAELGLAFAIGFDERIERLDRIAVGGVDLLLIALRDRLLLRLARLDVGGDRLSLLDVAAAGHEQRAGCLVVLREALLEVPVDVAGDVVALLLSVIVRRQTDRRLADEVALRIEVRHLHVLLGRAVVVLQHL